MDHLRPDHHPDFELLERVIRKQKRKAIIISCIFIATGTPIVFVFKHMIGMELEAWLGIGIWMLLPALGVFGLVKGVFTNDLTEVLSLLRDRPQDIVWVYKVDFERKSILYNKETFHLNILAREGKFYRVLAKEDDRDQIFDLIETYALEAYYGYAYKILPIGLKLPNNQETVAKIIAKKQQEGGRGSYRIQEEMHISA